MAAKIPMRPTDKSVCGELNEDQMNALTYYVISGCTKEFAYARFIAFEYKVTRMSLVKMAGELWGSRYAKDYMTAYRKTLAAFVSNGGMAAEAPRNAEEEPRTDMSNEDINKRKAEAVQKIIDYILDEADHIKDADDPETLVKIADKVGLFDEFEKAAEAPRRYLPVDRCGDCRYYQFCTSDEVIDECGLCRYKEYAEANGVRYDHKTMLRKGAEE